MEEEGRDSTKEGRKRKNISGCVSLWSNDIIEAKVRGKARSRPPDAPPATTIHFKFWCPIGLRSSEKSARATADSSPSHGAAATTADSSVFSIYRGISMPERRRRPDTTFLRGAGWERERKRQRPKESRDKKGAQVRRASWVEWWAGGRLRCSATRMSLSGVSHSLPRPSNLPSPSRPDARTFPLQARGQFS